MLSARAGFLFSLSCLSLKSQNEQEAMRMAMNIRMWTKENAVGRKAKKKYAVR